MNKFQKETIVESIKTIIFEQDRQGYNVKTDLPPNYFFLITNELSRLENFSVKYVDELKIISRFIRLKIWNKENDSHLFNLLHRLNQIYAVFSNIIGTDIFWNLNTVIEYAIQFLKFEKDIVSENDAANLIDEIQMASAKNIIPKQWEDILSADDSSKAFIDIFDDVFRNAIEKYPDTLLVKLSKTNELCRMVKVKDCDEDRFIPWPNKTNNRWNPPGKTYLYLSYGEIPHPFNDNLTLEERVCVLECRTDPNTDCSFCRFEPLRPGKIIDLSFNDEPLSTYRNILEKYIQSNTSKIVEELLSNQDVRLRANDELYIKGKIREKIKNLSDLDQTVMESVAKQYLKMICSCIYSKVDGTEEEKEKAYRSFQLLAEYLIRKGITGIIYPCTRDEKLKGKNIVLFDPSDAKPIVGSIRQYHYDGN